MRETACCSRSQVGACTVKQRQAAGKIAALPPGLFRHIHYICVCDISTPFQTVREMGICRFKRGTSSYLIVSISIDVEFVGIISAAGLRNCAEHAVAFTSGDDSRIIVLILFQVAASVLLDCAGSRGSKCVGGEVPVPFAGRIGRHEDIISVGSVDNIPFELDILAAGHAGTDVLGPGRNEYDVGPGAGLQNFLGTVDLEGTNLELIYMLVVEAGNSNTVVAAIQSTADVVASVCPCASDLICIGSGYCVPVDIAG